MASALHRTATRKAALRLVPLLFLAYFFSYLDRTNIGLVAPALDADLGIGATAFGFGAGIFFLGYAALEVPSNLILYRVGPRRWIARIAVSWGIICAAMVFMHGPLSFYLLRLLLGVAEAGLYPGLMYIVTVWFAQRDRARIVGYLLLATSLAYVLGNPLSGALLTLNGALGLRGWQWMYLIEAVPAIAVGIAIWFRLPDTPAEAAWLSPDEAAVLASESEPPRPPRLDARLGSTLGDPVIRTVAAIYLLNQVAATGIVFFGPAVIGSLGAAGTFVIGLLAGGAGLGAMAGVLVLPRVLRRLGREVGLTAVCNAGAMACSAVFLLVSSPVVRYVMLICLGFFLSGVLPLFWSVAMAHIRGRAAAVGLAFVNAVGVSGGFFGPYLFGIADGLAHDSAAGLWVIISASALSLALLPVLIGALRHRDSTFPATSPQAPTA